MRGRHTRDHLAGLLWPEYEQTNARASLRRTLSVLHQALAESELDIDRESLGLRSDTSLHVDVHEFQRHLASCQSHGHAAGQLCADCLEPLTAAVALYRGDFLAGFALRDSPPFDDWQYLQQESLRRDMISALERLAEGYSLEHEFETAIKYTRRWLELDRLHETAHRQLMLLYTWTGNRSAALHQYRICVRTLEEELGVAPLEATTGLYEAIKESRTPPLPGEKLAASGSTAIPFTTRLTARPLFHRDPRPQPPSQESMASAPAPHQAPEAQRGSVALGQLQTPASYPLVERGAEWSALKEAYRRLTDPDPGAAPLRTYRVAGGRSRNRQDPSGRRVQRPRAGAGCPSPLGQMLRRRSQPGLPAAHQRPPGGTGGSSGAALDGPVTRPLAQ